jgi:hypothetical protein
MEAKISRFLAGNIKGSVLGGILMVVEPNVKLLVKTQALIM